MKQSCFGFPSPKIIGYVREGKRDLRGVKGMVITLPSLPKIVQVLCLVFWGN